MYEDPTKEVSSDERFHVELHFSPGVNCCIEKDLPPGKLFKIIYGRYIFMKWHLYIFSGPGFRPQSRNQRGESSQQEGGGRSSCYATPNISGRSFIPPLNFLVAGVFTPTFSR